MVVIERLVASASIPSRPTLDLGWLWFSAPALRQLGRRKLPPPNRGPLAPAGRRPCIGSSMRSRICLPRCCPSKATKQPSRRLLGPMTLRTSGQSLLAGNWSYIGSPHHSCSDPSLSYFEFVLVCPSSAAASIAVADLSIIDSVNEGHSLFHSSTQSSGQLG